jgi:hypothetical protein
VNFGAARSRSQYVTICIDGARIMSPGILHWTALATRLSDRPVVATLAWHLGEKVQNEAIEEGYDEDIEDQLLERCRWTSDGYRLFEVAHLATSSAGGWFLPFAESNCLTVSREMFDTLGGFEERFESEGGGLANLDYFARASELPGSDLIVLLGEGTFHQVHGGVATNVPRQRHPWQEFEREYARIRGGPYRMPARAPWLLGTIPPAALPFLDQSAKRALERARTPLL